MRSIIRHALLCTFALFPLVAWGAAESVEPANLPKAVVRFDSCKVSGRNNNQR